MFGGTEILYLGHLPTGTSISPDPKKFEAVEGWPTPQTVTQVRSFLSFTNYFRRFIQGYADLASPFDEITGKGAHFSWNDQRQAAFEQLKKALLQAPVLQLADVSRPFRVYTDTSGTSIAAVLMQSKDDNLHPVAYISRKLTSAERNYTIAERESLAVVFALRNWRLNLFKLIPALFWPRMSTDKDEHGCEEFCTLL